jgi:hypothetical protein
LLTGPLARRSTANHEFRTLQLREPHPEASAFEANTAVGGSPSFFRHSRT